MKVGVVIINYYSTKDTIKCVLSLAESKPVPELVVIDNGSHGNKLKNNLSPYPFLKLIKSKKNLGFGRGNNLGIRYLLTNSDCDAIFLLNNDTTIEENTIQHLINILNTCPNAAVASPRIMRIDKPEKLLFCGASINWYRGTGKLDDCNDLSLNIKKKILFATGCAMLIRREVFEKIGGFDPRFFMYEEDLELCLRIQKAGWDIIYEPKSVVFHRLHGSQGANDKVSLSAFDPKNPRLSFFAFHMTKNRLLNMSIHARGIHAFMFVFGFPVYSSYNILRFLSKGRFDGIVALFKGIYSFMISRKGRYINELYQRNDSST
jgi:GT2 family glycosyltransferase